MPVAYVFLPRDLADAFSPFVRQEPVEAAGLGASLVQPGQALPGTGGDGRLHLGQPPATSRGRAQDGHACLAAARIARSVPPSGAGNTLEVGAERGTAAEAGQPRDARVVHLGLIRERGTGRTKFDPAQLGRELGQQRGPYLRPVRVRGCRRGVLQGHRQQPPASGLVARAGRADLAAQRRHRRRVDRGEAQRQRPGDVAQLEPRQRGREHHEHVAAAGGRDVGEDLAAAAGHEPGEGLGLNADLSREDSVTFMAVPDGSIVNITACAGGIKVKRQHPAGARARDRRPAPCTAGPEARRAAAGHAGPGRCGRRRARS